MTMTDEQIREHLSLAGRNPWSCCVETTRLLEQTLDRAQVAEATAEKLRAKRDRWKARAEEAEANLRHHKRLAETCEHRQLMLAPRRDPLYEIVSDRRVRWRARAEAAEAEVARLHAENLELDVLLRLEQGEKREATTRAEAFEKQLLAAGNMIAKLLTVSADYVCPDGSDPDNCSTPDDCEKCWVRYIHEECGIILEAVGCVPE